MDAYHLDAADAYHIAIARAEGINAFVTLDQGFGAVDTLNLYTGDLILLQNQTTAIDILPFR
jgi:predicted nucleic acid-binding protein